MNIRKKSISIILVIALCLTVIASPSYANALEKDSDIKVSRLGENSYMLDIGGEESIVEYEYLGDCTITNVTEKSTGEQYYFIRDNIKNTIYSSLTDTTIDIVDSDANSNIMAKSASERNAEIKRISTAKIYSAVSATGNATKIATYILSYFNIIGGTTALIIRVLSGAAIGTAAALKKYYKDVQLEVYEYLRSTTKNGKVYKYWVKSYRNVTLIKY